MATYKITMLRHGESAWNADNKFCGWYDADLAESGVQEAERAAQVWYNSSAVTKSRCKTTKTTSLNDDL